MLTNHGSAVWPSAGWLAFGGRGCGSDRLGLCAKPPETKDRSAAAEPRPVATADKMLSGRVADETGKPVVGAELWLPWTSYGHGGFRVLHARTDPQGRFALQIPYSWVSRMRNWDFPMIVWAYAAGRQVGFENVFGLLNQGNPSEAVIRLGPASDMSVVVLDPKGRPRGEALVEPGGVNVQTRLYGLFMGLPHELLRESRCIRMPKVVPNSRHSYATCCLASA